MHRTLVFRVGLRCRIGGSGCSVLLVIVLGVIIAFVGALLAANGRKGDDAESEYAQALGRVFE